MPQLIIRDSGGVARTITALVIRDGTNTPRTITELRVRDGTNTSRLVFNPSGSAALTATPSSIYESATASFGQNDATSASVSLTIGGGVAPYTVAWTRAYYNGPVAPVADSPTGTSTTFTQTNLSAYAAYTGIFYALVTDSNTPPTTIASDSVQIDFFGYLY